jgi:Holliday junction resolvase
VATSIEGKSHPAIIKYPPNLSAEAQAAFIEELHARAASPEGLIREAQLIELSIEQRIAVFDTATGVLQINTLHPFVAHFLDEFESKKQSLPLELLVMSEVLMEAHLYEQGLEEDVVRDVMARRDELLRYLARSTGKRTAYMVAQDLIDASTDKQKLETELVTAFDTMGFDAVPLGGSNRADGKAEAHLAAANPGQVKRYAVSLEAKSKERAGKKVSADRVNISAIARHRDDLKCDHALVAGPDFPTKRGEQAALVREVVANTGQTKRTITLIRVVDLAKLVRLVPLKRVGLDKIRGLFQTCRTPEECREWIGKLEKEEVSKVPYRDVLETIWRLQNERPSEPVEYAGVAVALDRDKKIKLTKEDLKSICQALSRMAPTMIAARETSVEMSQRTDKVVETLRAVIQQYPRKDQLAFHA